MGKDLEAIRHYKGTVADFKNFFDQKAAQTAAEDKANTNAFGTPAYQGFNDVHPTRGANQSDHWEESNVYDENITEDVEVTQEMWDKEWKIRKTFGKEYDEHFAKRIEAAMSKAKDGEMAENWAFINWKQLPGKANGMTIKESVNEGLFKKKLNPSEEAWFYKIADQALDILKKKDSQRFKTATVGGIGPGDNKTYIDASIDLGAKKADVELEVYFDKDKKVTDIKESVNEAVGTSNSNTNAVNRLPLFEDFQG